MVPLVPKVINRSDNCTEAMEKKSELPTKKGQQTYLLHAHDDASWTLEK